MKKPLGRAAPRPPQDVIAEMIDDAAGRASPDKLDTIRRKMRVLRDIELHIGEFEEKISHLKQRRLEITERELVDLMDGAGVRDMTLEAEGNYKPFVVEVGPYYHANIAAEWPDEKRSKAFAWIGKHHPGMLRNTITISCGKGTAAQQKKITELATKLKLSVKNEFGVPWNTLTAFVKEQIEEEGKTPPLDLLGATVGRVAKIKKAKEK